MNKILIIGIIFLTLLLLATSFYFQIIDNQMEENKPKQYQGPVRPGDDEEYFRETGITRPQGVEE